MKGNYQVKFCQHELSPIMHIYNGYTTFVPSLVYMYSDDSLNQTRLFPADISGLTSFPDYWIAH